MKPLTAQDPETHSPDIVAGNVEQLKALFPEAFTEGKLDFEVLKQLLGGIVEEREEKYGLNWHGKRRARQLALTPSTGTLRPCPEDSADWDTTRNLMIEGDNLEVLKLLQKSYASKVKLIYIDPPYNTGKEFVYPDDFQDNIKNYLQITGQVDGNGYTFSSNTESSGRFHTDWLNMMYPRLKLAKNLLRKDGAIFISVDDNERDNLRKICDEVFGEENFAAACVWQKRYSRENRGAIGDAHEYLLVYTASIDEFQESRSLIPMTEDQAEVYKNPNNDPKGRWRGVPMTAQGFRPNQMYEIIAPSGQRHTPPEGRCWSMIESQYLKLKEEGRIYFGKDGSAQPSVIRYLSEVEGLVPWTWWPSDEVGHTDEARKEIREIFGTQTVFDTPKPLRLIKRILEIGAGTDGIVLDFFAGSGTTAHALMLMNAKDGGKRRFVAVQLPEPTSQEKYRTVSEITKERLRIASRTIREESPMFAGDLGFRVFKLASSNIRAWEPNRDDLPATLEESIDHLKSDRTEQDILFELLLKRGLDLTVPMEQKTIAGKAVHSVGAGTLLACLAEKIATSEVEQLALGIVAWHKTLSPAGDTTIVFRDSAFADDVAKTNLTAILQQHGLENVRSL